MIFGISNSFKKGCHLYKLKNSAQDDSTFMFWKESAEGSPVSLIIITDLNEIREARAKIADKVGIADPHENFLNRNGKGKKGGAIDSGYIEGEEKDNFYYVGESLTGASLHLGRGTGVGEGEIETVLFAIHDGNNFGSIYDIPEDGTLFMEEPEEKSLAELFSVIMFKTENKSLVHIDLNTQKIVYTQIASFVEPRNKEEADLKSAFLVECSETVPKLFYKLNSLSCDISSFMKYFVI